MFKNALPPGVQRVLVNTFSLSTAQVIKSALGFLLSVFIANEMGVSFFGRFSILLAYVTLAQQVTTAGVSQFVIRELARNPANDRDIFATYFFNQIAFAILGIGALLLLSLFFPYSREVTQAIQIGSLTLIPFAVSNSVESLFRAREKMHISAFSVIVGRVFTTIGVAYAIYKGNSLIGAAWLLCLGQTLGMFVAIAILIFDKSWPSFKIDFKQVGTLFKISYEFILLNISVIIFSKLDILILSLFVDNRFVGIYNAAWLVIQLVNTVSVTFSWSTYPLMSRTFSGKGKNYNKIFWYSLGTVTLFTFIGMLIIMFGRNQIIRIVFRSADYINGGAPEVLLLLAPFVVIFAANSILSNTLFASNKQQKSLIVSTSKLIIGIFVYLIGVYFWGIYGAAVATVVTGIIGTVLNSWFLTDLLPGRAAILRESAGERK